MEKSFLLKDIFILLFIYFLWWIISFYWITNDNHPPQADSSAHILKSYNLYRNFTFLLFNSPLKLFTYEPVATTSFFYFPILPFYFFFLPTNHISIIVNSVYFGILLFSTYGIGKKLFGKNVGLCSVFFIISYPSIFSLSRHLFLDFASMCIVMLTIYFLICSDFFRNRKYSFLFGISFGIATLIKLTNFMFLIVILVYIVSLVLRKNDLEAFKTFLISTSFSIILISLWILPNISLFLSTIKNNLQFYRLPVKYFQLMTYVLDALSREISIFHLLFFSIASGIFLIKTLFYKSGLKNKNWATILIFQVAVVYLTFFMLTLIYFPHFQLHDVFYRHVIPILPLIGIFTASQITTGKIKKYIWILCLASFIQFLIISLGVPNFVGIYLKTDMYYFFPAIKNWKIEDIINEIDSFNKSEAKCLVIGDFKFLRSENFQLYALLNKKKACSFEDLPYFVYYFENSPPIESYDFVITEDLKNPNFYPIRNITTLNYILQQLNESYNCYKQYEIKGEYNYPLGSNITICRNKKLLKVEVS
jgi:4-amino-4-deoxy-L-arabinose transferase-like glycosyltransferase